MLIIRELLLGSNRFSHLQKGLPRISPTVLNTRLKELESNSVIVKRKLKNQKGHEYQLTPAGKELSTVIESLVVWGMRWARDEMEEDDLDISFLMFDIQRNIVIEELPGGENVLCFQYEDLDEFGRWWLICNDKEIDLCYENPGKDVDIYVTANSRDMVDIWMGDLALNEAINKERIKVMGDSLICKQFKKWFPLSSAAHIERPTK